MTLMNSRDFSDWDTFYRKNDYKTMPWFLAELDRDLKDAMDKMGIKNGNFLDLGTGPGTQAVQLQKMGFDATGSDISESAIQGARQLGDATFVVDDILNSKLSENNFDYILDRGCFHVFDSKKHVEYIKNIKKIQRQEGYLFLKCMSVKETDLAQDRGPYRYSHKQIENIFSDDYEILEFKDTVYYGTIRPQPKAIFFVMRKNRL